MVATGLIVALSATQARSDGREEIPFEEASIFFELNDTDGDLGIHALIDGDPWKLLRVEDPHDRTVLFIKLNGALRQQGLTELFFESAEPSFDELEPEEFFARFPPGMYEIEGITLDGQELESAAELTHVLPAPPENVLISGVAAAPDCDSDPLPSASRPIIISWDPVTHSHPELGVVGEPIDVVQYQLVVELELQLEPEPAEPTVFVYSVDLPPDRTRMAVPGKFIKLGEEFKFEILVREASGNQTAIESCFLVE